jgi:phosphoribosylformimino-5-aminoimidazole carboxamide ribotide isomerase
LRGAISTGGAARPLTTWFFPNITNVVGTETAHYSLSQYTGGYLSIDIKNGKTIPSGENPVHILKKAGMFGFDGGIILNLSAVGTGAGISDEHLERMREVYNKPLLYGGGVAGTKDLDRLRDFGYDGAIVATGVHKGTIPVEAVRRGTWS